MGWLACYRLSIQAVAQIAIRSRNNKPIHETHQGPRELSILDIPEVPEKVDGFGESGQVGDRKGSCHLQLGGASNTFFSRFLVGKGSSPQLGMGPNQTCKKGTCDLEVGTQVVSKVKLISWHVFNHFFPELRAARVLNEFFS